MRGAYVQNEKKLSRYQQAVESDTLPVERGFARTREDEMRRELIHELMCNHKLDLGR